MPELDETTLGAALRATDVPASVPDIPALVAAGRRRDRWRRTAAVGGVFVTVAGVTALATLVAGGHRVAPKPITPPGLTSCVAGPVTPLPGDGARVTAVDPTGRYAIGIVGHKDGHGGLVAENVIWDNGVAHPVAEPGYAITELKDVNASGWVVGISTVTVDHVEHWRPALYRDGKWTLLPMPADTEDGMPTSINSSGDIVGRASGNGWGVPVLWPAARPGTVVTLAVPNPNRSAYAATISDAGVIGGSLDSAFGIPYVWTSPTSGHALQWPKQMYGGVVVMIRGNYAVGYVSWPVTNLRIAVWDLRTGVVRLDDLPAGVDDVRPSFLGGMDAAGAHAVYVKRVGEWISYIVQPGGPTIKVPVPPGVAGQYPKIVAMSDDGHRLTGQLVDDRGAETSGPMTWTCS